MLLPSAGKDTLLKRVCYVSVQSQARLGNVLSLHPLKICRVQQGAPNIHTSTVAAASVPSGAELAKMCIHHMCAGTAYNQLLRCHPPFWGVPRKSGSSNQENISSHVFWATQNAGRLDLVGIVCVTRRLEGVRVRRCAPNLAPQLRRRVRTTYCSLLVPLQFGHVKNIIYKRARISTGIHADSARAMPTTLQVSQQIVILQSIDIACIHPLRFHSYNSNDKEGQRDKLQLIANSNFAPLQPHTTKHNHSYPSTFTKTISFLGSGLGSSKLPG